MLNNIMLIAVAVNVIAAALATEHKITLWPAQTCWEIIAVAAA